MSFSSVGDMAHSYLMRGHNSRIKSELSRLSETLASGQHTDMSKQLNGEFSSLSTIERSIRTLEANQTTSRETQTLLEAAQLSLGTIQSISSEAAPALISAGNSSHAALLGSSSKDAAQKFDSIVSALNVQIAGRAVFSGAATDRAALPSGPELLASLTSDLGGATTRTEIINGINAWFMDSSGSYANVQYQGSDYPLPPIHLSDHEKVKFEVTAQAPEIRKLLQAFAMASLVSELPALSNSQDKAAMLTSAGELMLSAQTDISILRADIGSQEEYAENIAVRNSSQLSGYEIARSAMYQADPYQAATELELAQAQLETMYTLTARISRLSLSDYLR